MIYCNLANKTAQVKFAQFSAKANSNIVCEETVSGLFERSFIVMTLKDKIINESHQ